MKKTNLIVTFVILLCAFVFISCNKNKDGEEVITVNGKAVDTITMDAEGDSQTVIVRGTTAWKAESTSWITVDPKSGRANTDVTVTISVGPNGNEERTGSALFSLETSEFVDVIVVQPALIAN